MEVIVDFRGYHEFPFWSGAKQTLEYLTNEEAETIWEMLGDIFYETPTATQINDFFWFEDDIIAEMLGYKDFEEIIERGKKKDEER